MRRAIAEADVGDAVLGDDPTMDELEAYAAGLLGKDRALFFPSGIMANQTALIALGEPGTEALIDGRGHIFDWEEAAAAALGGVQLRPVATPDGLLTPELVLEHVPPPTRFATRTSIVCLENTHNAAGGRVLPPAQAEAVAAAARERGARVHLDGARLPNAAVATGRSLKDLAAPADTVMVALSKGLGAPVGSLLAGPEDVMERAWRARRRLGGGMRQAGILAAAALYGLRHNFALLAEDHRRARELAAAAGEAPGLAADAPDTNIVMVRLEDPRLAPEALLAALERRGVRMTRFGARRLRAVTHLDVDDAAVGRAGEALREAAEELLGDGATA
jgi:threonine aldolase